MKKTMLCAAVLTLLLVSCDEDILNPEGLSYSKSVFDITFYESGQTGVPTIMWNGSIGTFGLADSYPGVSINSSTGAVSWNGDLPVGENDVTIIATNANGSKQVSITLNHIFSGSFTGSYNYDPTSMTVSGDNYGLTFNSDGTIIPRDFTTYGSGTYTIDDNNNISAAYSYGFGDVYLDAKLTYSSSQNPYIDGLWGTNEANPNTGYFRVDKD